MTVDDIIEKAASALEDLGQSFLDLVDKLRSEKTGDTMQVTPDINTVANETQVTVTPAPAAQETTASEETTVSEATPEETPAEPVEETPTTVGAVGEVDPEGAPEDQPAPMGGHQGEVDPNETENPTEESADTSSEPAADSGAGT